MELIKIKKGIQTDFSAIVKLNGKIVDLTTYTAKLIMVSKTGVKKIDAVATISAPLTGVVEYKPTATDVDTKGIYKAYFVLSVGGVKKLSAPTDYFKVDILDDFL